MLCTLTTPEKRASKGHEVEEVEVVEVEVEEVEVEVEEVEEGEDFEEGLLSKLIFAVSNLIRISHTQISL